VISVSKALRRSSREIWISLTSFVEPGAIYRTIVTPASPPALELFHRTQLAVPHDPQDYVTRQVKGCRHCGVQKSGSRLSIRLRRCS